MKNQKKFTESFSEIYPTLVMRYSTRRELDVLNEFIQFIDNTREGDLQSLVMDKLMDLNHSIYEIITAYENGEKEDIVESSH